MFSGLSDAFLTKYYITKSEITAIVEFSLKSILTTFQKSEEKDNNVLFKQRIVSLLIIYIRHITMLIR